MNFFEADGMYKVGNVELKFIVDFEKNGDMLLWKTQKHGGFVFTKNIIGAYIYCQQTVRIVTPSFAIDINCDGEETAKKILNIIIAINVKLYAGKKLGVSNLENIGEDVVSTCNDSRCGECSCGENNGGERMEFNEFMSTFLSKLSASFKEEKK